MELLAWLVIIGAVLWGAGWILALSTMDTHSNLSALSLIVGNLAVVMAAVSTVLLVLAAIGLRL